jgi:16S rRNA (guanine1207-N2)-methyltransferase
MIETEIKGVSLQFETNDNIFSPSAVDVGTLSMLSQVEFKSTDKVLDLGCGYGIVGILAGKLIGAENVTLCDISEDAIRLSKINADRNNLENLKIFYTHIIKSTVSC